MLLAVVCLSFSIGESYAQKNDFGNLARYSKQNAALPKATKKDKRVIFMGNSITEGWVRTHPDFFKSNGYIGRGISGQTSYQFLLRFREDVINLSPALVVINAGTNDVAENTQAYNEDYTFGNICSDEWVLADGENCPELGGEATFSFGEAIKYLKRGMKVARKGWNGKEQYIQLAAGISYKTADGDIVNCEHDAIGNMAIAFCGTSGVQMGWLASQADMLAEDWKFAE